MYVVDVILILTFLCSESYRLDANNSNLCKTKIAFLKTTKIVSVFVHFGKELWTVSALFSGRFYFFPQNPENEHLLWDDDEPIFKPF